MSDNNSSVGTIKQQNNNIASSKWGILRQNYAGKHFLELPFTSNLDEAPISYWNVDDAKSFEDGTCLGHEYGAHLCKWLQDNPSHNKESFLLFIVYGIKPDQNLTDNYAKTGVESGFCRYVQLMMMHGVNAIDAYGTADKLQESFMQIKEAA